MTAQNAKSEPGPELLQEFDIEFSKEEPEAIEWAFRSWRLSSPFMPAISEIAGLIRDWKRLKREKEQEQNDAAERILLNKARAEGKLLDFPQTMKTLIEDVAKFPEPEHARRQRAYRERETKRVLTPPIDLSKESPEDRERRREREHREIEDYENKIIS